MNGVIARLILILFLLSYVWFLLSLYDANLVFKGDAALIFLLGAIMFSFVFLIQNPIQIKVANSQLLVSKNYILGITVISVVAGFLQEFLKIIPALYKKWNMFFAAASGAGFGFIEAVIMTVPLPSLSVLAIAEWVIIITFQMAATAFIVYGFGISMKKGILFFIAMSIVHMGVEFLIVLQKMKPMVLPYTDLFLLLITLPVLLISVKKYRDTLL